MKAVFVETAEFTRRVAEELPDDLFAAVQRRLMDDPNLGNVIPGCGGLRKLRVPDPSRGKGKRGGWRLIYVYVPEARRFLLLDLYGKGEQKNLEREERRLLKGLAERFKAAAIASTRKSNEG